MSLQVTVSSATIMEGPPGRIAREARLRMLELGQQGGYVCQPDQGMPYPPLHLQSLHTAVAEY